MNKLVSKNPVLRFKEGKKIVKAQFGDIIQIDSKNDIWQDKSTGKKYLRNWKGRRWNRTPQGTSSNDFGNYFLEYSPSVPQLRIGMNGEPIVDSVSSQLNTNNNLNTKNYIPVGGIQALRSKYLGKSNMDIAKEETHNYLEGLRNKYSRPFLKTTVIPQLLTQTGKTILKKDSTTPSVFAGHRIGKTGGLNYNINGADKLQLIGTGQFTESDFTNAMATQKALNRYFANSGLGSVVEDGAWGDQSRAALDLALSKSKGLTPLNNETTVVKTPIIPAYTPPTTPTNLEVANLKLNVNVPQQTYDRTGIREYLRSRGLNPYSFSGALRRALRMIMNGQGTDNDKLLVKGMNIFKQGGLLLSSRNPITRFRNRNFK